MTLSAAACAEVRSLLGFAAAARRPDGGFGELDNHGRLAPDAPLHPLQTARMTFSFAIGSLLGAVDAAPLAAHGVRALATLLRDPLDGGTLSDPAHPDLPKAAYLANFTALAGAAAAEAGIDGADDLLEHAAGILADRFWSEDEDALVDEWERGFGRPLEYRGANSNMHAVETFCALGAHTGQRIWFERAARIAAKLIDRIGRGHDWMLPEHFDSGWQPQFGYNRDRPDDEFRPYGVTIGHLLEWSRLLLELHTEVGQEWLLGASRALYDTGTRLGWEVDGRPGFVYTVDWDATPVVHSRPHWVALEAVAAAATQAQAFGDPAAVADQARFADYAGRFLRDRALGSWHHELDRENRPVARMWSGKPDAYHALTFLLVPELPLAASLTARLRAARTTDTDEGQPTWSIG